MAWIAAAITAVAGLASADMKSNKQMLAAPGMATPDTTNGRSASAIFDNSGWNVNFGAGSVTSKASSANSQTPTTTGTSVTEGLAGVASSMGVPSNMTAYIVLGIVIVAILKHHKRGG